MAQEYLYSLTIGDDKPIRMDDLMWMMAKALHPNDEFACASAHLNIKRDVQQAVERGQLIVRNSLDMGPHTFPYGAALESAVLLPLEARQLLYARGIELRLEPSAPPAPEAASPSHPDRGLLATPDELVMAFGAFTGMSTRWFERLTDKPQLRAARKVSGQGGRGHTREPLFCPFEVMQWLLDPKRKIGSPISQEKAWGLLEKHFRRVYAARSVADPRGEK